MIPYGLLILTNLLILRQMSRTTPTLGYQTFLPICKNVPQPVSDSSQIPSGN